MVGVVLTFFALMGVGYVLNRLWEAMGVAGFAMLGGVGVGVGALFWVAHVWTSKRRARRQEEFAATYRRIAGDECSFGELIDLVYHPAPQISKLAELAVGRWEGELTAQEALAAEFWDRFSARGELAVFVAAVLEG